MTLDVLAFQLKATVWLLACTPVPERVIVAGDPVALLVTVNVPFTLPAEAGLKLGAMVRVCEGESVTGVLAPFTPNPVPLGIICEIVTSEFPVFVMPTFSETDPAVATFPKPMLVLVNASVRMAATPVPLSANVLGEEGALLTIDRLPGTVPAAVGRYCTLSELVAPGFKDSGRVMPLALNPLPVAFTWLMVSIPVPGLLTCTV